MPENLSKGQLRIQEIIHKYYPKFASINPDWKTSSTPLKDKLFAQIQRDFEEDPIINSDPITAQPLHGYTMVSPNYIAWADMTNSKSTVTKVRQSMFEVSLERYQYEFSDKKDMRPRYSGGSKYHVTYNCLFALSQNRQLPPGDLSAEYYPESKILVKSGGGNHRMLAHVLWGNPKINFGILDIFSENSFNQELFDGLMIIDQIFGKLDVLTCSFKFKDYSLEEAEIVKEIAFQTTDEEKKVLINYRIHYLKTVSKETERLPFVWLNTHLELLRTIRERKPDSFLSNLENYFKRKEPVSQSEAWYQNFRPL